MRWGFTIPGGAPSVNGMYRPDIIESFRADGTPYLAKTISKRQSVKDWQASVVPVIRAARPRGWNPPGQVRIVFRFYLQRDADADNLLKALNDCIQAATGVNDKRYLPCVELKQSGVAPSKARIEVDIVDL